MCNNYSTSLLLSLVLCLRCMTGYSQDSAGVSSVGYIQTGFAGIWGGAEWKVGPRWAVRTEAGLDFGFRGGEIVGETRQFLTPVFNVEPRFYYNILRRTAAGKNTAGNSGNFLTLRMDYHPDWFTISNQSDVHVVEQFQIIPKWGIRRHIGSSHFNYELGIGIGYRHYFLSRYNINDKEDEIGADLHIRIGYTF